MYRYSTSSNQASFRSDSPLSNETIARYAPSVLATEAHESRGERYSFIPTISVKYARPVSVTNQSVNTRSTWFACVTLMQSARSRKCLN